MSRCTGHPHTSLTHQKAEAGQGGCDLSKVTEHRCRVPGQGCENPEALALREPTIVAPAPVLGDMSPGYLPDCLQSLHTWNPTAKAVTSGGAQFRGGGAAGAVAWLWFTTSTTKGTAGSAWCY